MTHLPSVCRATSTTSAIVSALGLLIMFSQLAFSAEPPKKPKRPFPAKIEIVGSKHVDGRCELDVEIVPDANVQIYADTESDTPVADLSIRTSDGVSVTAESVYLKSKTSHIDSEKLGYTGKLTYTVKFTVPTNEVALKLHCKLAGWNQQRSCCLGFGTISADIPVKR